MMDEVVLHRLREVCPQYTLGEVNGIKELATDCKVAFEIIGYLPKNFNDSFNETPKIPYQYLSDFVYAVWKTDVEG